MEENLRQIRCATTFTAETSEYPLIGQNEDYYEPAIGTQGVDGEFAMDSQSKAKGNASVDV